MPVMKASCLARSALATLPMRLPLPVMLLQKSEVRMPNGAIREVGAVEITLQLHGDVSMLLLACSLLLLKLTKRLAMMYSLLRRVATGLENA